MPFVSGIRCQHYSKLLVAGIPRMTPIRKRTEGELRFHIIDPGGNWIRIGQQVTPAEPATTVHLVQALVIRAGVRCI